LIARKVLKKRKRRRMSKMSEFVWGPVMVVYLFLGGLAGGSYTVGALADLFNKKEYKTYTKSGILSSFVSIVLGLVMLVFDLKRFDVAPVGILHVYTRFPDSIMSVGTWIITAFTLVSLLTVLILFLSGDALIRKILEVVGIFLGLGTAAYTGILLSFARGIPVWQSGFLPWLFVLSGLLTGMAISIIVIPIAGLLMPMAFGDFKAMWDSKERFAGLIEYTDKYAQSLIVVETVVMFLYFVTTPSTSILWWGSGVSVYFYAYLLLALAIPLAIAIYDVKLMEEGKHETVTYLTLLATILVLVGGYLLRYVVLMGGQMLF
jgi:formate-dependent nitrite reductase membrane component NrfD